MPVLKIYFDYASLSSLADKEVDYKRSHLEINTQDADVCWFQVLKGQPDHHGEKLVVVEGGVIMV